jgi:hypothetical protein
MLTKSEHYYAKIITKDLDMGAKYEDQGNSVFEWVYTADNLVESANILRKESYHWSGKFGEMPDFRSYRITDVVTMLYAMAIECLLKAVWLLSGNKLVENGNYIGVDGNKSHQLASLAKRVEKTGAVTFCAKDCEILEELSRNITSGRYPIEANMKKQFEDFFVPIRTYEEKNKVLIEKKAKSFEDIKGVLKKMYALTDSHVKGAYPEYLGLTKRCRCN